MTAKQESLFSLVKQEISHSTGLIDDLVKIVSEYIGVQESTLIWRVLWYDPYKPDISTCSYIAGTNSQVQQMISRCRYKNSKEKKRLISVVCLRTKTSYYKWRHRSNWTIPMSDELTFNEIRSFDLNKLRSSGQFYLIISGIIIDDDDRRGFIYYYSHDESKLKELSKIGKLQALHVCYRTTYTTPISGNYWDDSRQRLCSTRSHCEACGQSLIITDLKDDF